MYKIFMYICIPNNHKYIRNRGMKKQQQLYKGSLNTIIMKLLEQNGKMYGYEITQKRYDTGMGTIVDVNAAALAVTSAELQYRNAIYDYLAAKADLEKTLGYDSDTKDK